MSRGPDLNRFVLACDNAPDVANPAQRDLDGDAFGDRSLDSLDPANGCVPE